MNFAERGYRRLTSWLRPLPGILVVGAMRSGTTSLFRTLLQHPDVNTSGIKETHFFDRHFHRGIGWYRSFFHIGTGIGIDNTPSYMVHAKSALRASQTVPQANLIALLRDPSERAWSHYRYRYEGKLELTDLETIIESDLASLPPALLDFSRLDEIPVLTGGFYAAQLKPWIDLFGDKQICVVKSETLFENPNAELQRIQESLGLVPVDLPFPRANAAAPAESTRLLEALREFYAKPNEELVNLLGTNFSWTKP